MRPRGASEDSAARSWYDPHVRAQRAPAPVDWKQFLLLDEDDPRELIDGRLEETEVPTKLHEWVVGCLVAALFAWARANKAGTVLPSGYKLRISRTRGVMADVVFIRRGRGHLAKNEGMEDAAPDLVIEVISPSSRRHDRVRKLRWYGELGVREYWIVDPEERTLERLMLDKRGRYVVSEALSEDDVFTPKGYDGLVIRLDELWAMPEE